MAHLLAVSGSAFGEIQVIRRQKAVSEKEELERAKAKAADERNKAAKKNKVIINIVGTRGGCSARCLAV